MSNYIIINLLVTIVYNTTKPYLPEFSMYRIVIILSVTLLFFSGCSLSEYRLFQTEDDKEVTRVTDKTYAQELVFENKIQPNDRLSIKVFTQSSGAQGQQMTSMLSSRAEGRGGVASEESIGMLVTKRGTVRLPLVGSVKIIGLTEDEAANKLIKSYKKYLRSPYVMVEIMNQRLYVLGEVKKPGVVQVTNGTMNVLEAIARCGDMTDYAQRTNIKVIRGDLRDPKMRIIDLTHMSAISASSMYLKPNDILYIQPRTMKGYNMAFNEIAPPFQLLSSLLAPFVSIKYLSNN